MATETMNDLQERADASTRQIVIANNAINKLSFLLRYAREVIDIESNVNKPDELLVTQLNDLIDGAQKRRTQYQTWFNKEIGRHEALIRSLVDRY